MHIAFATKSLRQLCEDSFKAEKTLGGKVAEKLKHRLADISAANFTSELVAGTPKQLNKPHEDKLKIHLHEDQYLIISANHNVNPLLESGAVDWSKVSRVKVHHVGEGNA